MASLVPPPGNVKSAPPNTPLSLADTRVADHCDVVACTNLEKALEIDVVHDIPVKVMPANESSFFRPPEVHMPQVCTVRVSDASARA